MSTGVSSYFNNNNYLEMPKCPPKAGVRGSNPLGRAISPRCIPVTWFTPYTGDIVNTFSGANGLSMGSNRPIL